MRYTNPRLLYFYFYFYFTLPVSWGLRRNIAMLFGTEKLEWLGYPMVKKMKICLFVLTQSTNVTHRHRITANAALSRFYLHAAMHTWWYSDTHLSLVSHADVSWRNSCTIRVTATYTVHWVTLDLALSLGKYFCQFLSIYELLCIRYAQIGLLWHTM